MLKKLDRNVEIILEVTAKNFWVIFQKSEMRVFQKNVPVTWRRFLTTGGSGLKI